MSAFINENKVSPPEAIRNGIDAGSAMMIIEFNNGCLEVRNANNAIMMQTINMKDGEFHTIWDCLESIGETVYRAK